MKREEQFINTVKFSDVTRAISKNYSRLFCVNTDTDVYVEFIPHEQDEKLDIRTIGEDFTDIIDSFRDKTYTADVDTFCTAVTKENVLDVLEVDDFFSLSYRMISEGHPVYVRLKATRLLKDDPTHILVALSNTDAHMQRLAIYERAMSDQLTFATVSEALAADYDCIFYVNTETSEFVEYSSSDTYKSLGFPEAGNDFFDMCRSEFIRIVYEEDRDIFLDTFDKKKILDILSMDHLPLISFRVVWDKAPVYVLVKITRMEHIDDHHIIIGLSNIEANLPRIQQYEHMRKIANRDSLTGVKSKHAFMVKEDNINRAIAQGGVTPFAIVVCDVNGLKNINDTQGHQAGDEYLCQSCKMICDIFSHSPVYRVGGDEFVALLQNGDYEKRQELIQKLHDSSVNHIGTGEAVVSGGMSEYDSTQDHCLRDIFDRADALMYREKMLLKGQGAVTREDEGETSSQDTEDIPFINMRKHILIADDQEMNREILGYFLEDDYDILHASDGIETMRMLRKHKDEVALLLLDLHMPHMDGREVMKAMRIDEELMSIPVIMLTVDPDAELDALKLGAMDFISKPYPDINIVKARIAKCIELSEDRDLIRATQRDKLTRLLKYDYFLQYIDRYEHLHKDSSFDAHVCIINDLPTLHKHYGQQFVDHILRDIGINTRKLVRKTGGIGCRRGEDTFILYCPHQDNHEQMVRKFNTDLFMDQETADKVSLRFGVNVYAEREPDIEKRFTAAIQNCLSV